MTTIIEFLYARLDEDEAKAAAAARQSGYFEIEGWAWYDADFGGYHLWDVDDVNSHYPTQRGAIGGLATTGEYAERMRTRAQASNCDLPARALREIAAKRFLIDQWADRYSTNPHIVGYEESDAIDVLHALATVYADHPDYRQEWTP